MFSSWNIWRYTMTLLTWGLYLKAKIMVQRCSQRKWMWARSEVQETFCNSKLWAPFLSTQCQLSVWLYRQDLCEESHFQESSLKKLLVTFKVVKLGLSNHLGRLQIISKEITLGVFRGIWNLQWRIINSIAFFLAKVKKNFN